MNNEKKICFFSGIFQLAGAVTFLFLPLLVRVTSNYPIINIRGWQLIVGYINKIDVIADMAQLSGLSLLFFFCCGIVLVIAGSIGAVTSWMKHVPAIVPAIFSVLASGAQVFMLLHINGKLENTEYQYGSSAVVTSCCLAASVVIGVIAVCVWCSGKCNTPAPVERHEKLPDVAAKIEEKKYYQIVEQEPTPEEEEKEPAMPDIPDYVSGSEPRGVMVGLVGVYAGVEIAFQPNETIRVGRDSSSNLIYDKSAPRISRHHCEITWNSDNKTYSIMDTSTNGTFKNGSEDCLPQNMQIALEVGCTISLGDEDNTFRLE